MKNNKYLPLALALYIVIPTQSHATPVLSGCYFDTVTYTEICPISTEVTLFDLTGTADFYYETSTAGNTPGDLANSYDAVGTFEITEVSNSDTGSYSATGILNVQAAIGVAANYFAEFSSLGGAFALVSENFSGDFAPAILTPTVWEISPTLTGLALNTMPNPDYFFRDGILTDVVLDDSYVIDLSLTGVVSTIPVPAAIWLFGSGLIGLIGLAGRKA